MSARVLEKPGGVSFGRLNAGRAIATLYNDKHDTKSKKEGPHSFRGSEILKQKGISLREDRGLEPQDSPN